MIGKIAFILALGVYILKVGTKWMDFVTSHMGYNEKASFIFICGVVVLVMSPAILVVYLGVIV